jgi:hypothetical protein
MGFSEVSLGHFFSFALSSAELAAYPLLANAQEGAYRADAQEQRSRDDQKRRSADVGQRRAAARGEPGLRADLNLS